MRRSEVGDLVLDDGERGSAVSAWARSRRSIDVPERISAWIGSVTSQTARGLDKVYVPDEAYNDDHEIELRTSKGGPWVTRPARGEPGSRSRVRPVRA